MQSVLVKIVYAITRAILDAWRDWASEPHNATFLDRPGRAELDLADQLRKAYGISESTDQDFPTGKTDKS